MMATRSSRKRARLASVKTENKRASVSVSIDKDSLQEILSKLPVKSLIRFRCVSQEWYALTQNPLFITKQQLSCSNNPDMHLFVDHYPPPPPAITDKYGVFELSMCDSKSKFTRLDFSSMNNQELMSIRCVASSNGLICFYAVYESKYGLIVCNPTTKQFRYLPIPNPFRIERRVPLLGFEFLHDIGEYILASIYPESVENEELEVTFRVQLLTQSSNSWRRLNHELKFPTCKEDCLMSSSLTCNGVLYWIVKRSHTDNLFVLSFSLRNETFMHVIPFPSMAATFPPTMVSSLFQWENNSPALLLHSLVEPYQVLWVMKTSTDEIPDPSWIPQFKIRDSLLFNCTRYFKGFFNEYQYWIFGTSKGAYVLYDPARKKLRKFRKYGANKKYKQVMRYVQSLLPVI